jgi:hypothetical protein
VTPLPQLGAEHPNGVRVYESDPGEFTVSQHQCRLPGIYATEDAAVAAASLPDAVLYPLTDADVRGIGADYRPITLDEVKAAAERTGEGA